MRISRSPGNTLPPSHELCAFHPGFSFPSQVSKVPFAILRKGQLRDIELRNLACSSCWPRIVVTPRGHIFQWADRAEQIA